ncbi:DUF4189 domain-containing protein [Pseudomonas sp. S75]|uniref:DUF4189 domain-containing protein n=1 Tax=unclassified Pseudomonas TaxID=196821 RepID=UPI001903CE0F|nr:MULTISPECIES: DUF4189 domain-containing protein [unclassified Pseudomonas]MBJ9977214.1 DUF4189 domain-containing protein [Pseudomonas sp. S30]MBK0156207.1 DUF4189 domain-containing protein [Pseudomonas sp. S75]
MKKSLLLTMMVFFQVVGFAYAEGGCPAGEYPQQGNGWQNCVPIPGADQQSQPVAQPSPAESWGALATYVPKGIIGSSKGLSSKDAATRRALDNCQMKAGHSCKLEAYYQNACVALAGSDTGYAVNSKPALDLAENNALSTCRGAGYKNCIIFFSDCSKGEE